MKKTFNLTHPKIKTARLFERAKHDIRKYVKRERRKELPKGVDFWDFDCRFGPTEEEAIPVHLAEMSGRVDDIQQQGRTKFYVEILAKPGHRTKKPKANPATIGDALFDSPTVKPLSDPATIGDALFDNPPPHDSEPTVSESDTESAEEKASD